MELGDDMLFAVLDVANKHFSDDADTVVAQTESLSLEDGTLVWDLVCQVRILAYQGRDGDYLAFRWLDRARKEETMMGEWPVDLADRRQTARAIWHLIGLCST
ncbi:hypothetical protein CHR55_30410 [Rhodococcus qingshengii]|uniref:Uncharacterized protein n=1 Tax=Rhodococcus qingshengii TaxID=334542 RepID=A0A2A5J104_RHOSG|nr:hypothetical protein CHR55_30410 [Rhodococcus qingshengii]